MASINNKMASALNRQINEELYSAYLYFAMSADFESKNLKGFAAWMAVQAQEEMAHARKFFDFLLERGGAVELEAIAKPQSQWESPLAAFEAAYAHEQHISGCIDTLVDTARGNKDHATENFLQWFVSEQVEEEATASDIVQQLRLMADAPGGLYMLNRELGARTFTPPAAEA